MKRIFIIIILTSILSCKEGRNNVEFTEPLNETQQTSDLSSKNNISLKSESDSIIWKEKEFKNFKFKLPTRFKLQEHLSNVNKQVFTTDNDWGVSLDVEYLPAGYEKSSIKQLISNPADFSEEATLNLKKNFYDIKLVNYEFNSLGNSEAFLIIQNSEQISANRNSLTNLYNYFIIAPPYYCSITLSYPLASEVAPEIFKEIRGSFYFPKRLSESTDDQETTLQTNRSTTSSVTEHKGLDETKNWILSKFKLYGDSSYTYKVEGFNLIISTSNDPAVAITYTIPLCTASIYKDTFHTHADEMITFSVSQDRIKIDRNWKGFPHYESNFYFEFRYSSEDDLINRLNSALKNLQYYCPSKKKSNEPF